MEIKKQLKETASKVKPKLKSRPVIGIVLGTGLGTLASKIETEAKISYEDIPHFPKATAISHKGVLISGKIGGKNILAMEGRLHYYEGYSMKEITYPIRVMKELGCEYLIVSNACGGMNPYYNKGDIVLITDHINLMGDNPLRGPNDESLGPRFPDMSEPYSKELMKLAEDVAEDNGIKLKKGVYVAVSGPNLETAAEYRFLRIIGADMVGMSTVPEVLVAVHQGTKVLGLSVVTDIGFPGELAHVTVEEVIKVAEEAEPYVTQIIENVIMRINT